MSAVIIRDAARLIYKALHTALVPENDREYRELLATYRADMEFARATEDIAVGLELAVVDVTERGLIVVPSSRESRFAMRLGDIRVGLPHDQKAALLLAHVTVASVFFPTTEGLEDDNYIPPPAAVSQFRDALYGLARRLKETEGQLTEMPQELAPGWVYLASLPVVVPGIGRAGTNSIIGLVRLALLHMTQNGLVLLNRDAADETATTYTPRHRLRVQLRELALRRLFEIAQRAAQEPVPAIPV